MKHLIVQFVWQRNNNIASKMMLRLIFINTFFAGFLDGRVSSWFTSSNFICRKNRSSFCNHPPWCHTTHHGVTMWRTKKIDDEIKSIRNKILLYQEKTRPLIREWKPKIIDGNQTEKEVYESIKALLMKVNLYEEVKLNVEISWYGYEV